MMKVLSALAQPFMDLYSAIRQRVIARRERRRKEKEKWLEKEIDGC